MSEEQKPLEHLINYVNEFAPLAWSYDGAVVITRGELTMELPGSFSWSGSHGSGSLQSGDRASEALLKPLAYGAILKDEDFLTIRAADGSWEIRRAYVSSTKHTADFRVRTMTYEFSIEFLELRIGEAEEQSAASHALLISGVDFELYPTSFPTDPRGDGASLDGMVTSVLGRPAIIRQLPEPRPREPFLMVAYQGERLDREERRTVLHLLSFLTGRMGAVAGEFFLDGGEEKGRILESYNPDESIAKPPVQWRSPDLGPLQRLPAQLPQMFEAMHGLRVNEKIPLDVALTHLLSRPRLFDEEVRDIALALDSLIEADAFSRNGVTLVAAEVYERALPELFKAINEAITRNNLPTALHDRLKERLVGANDISHGERRRAFFERVGFEPGPREKAALNLRHPMSHRGYLWLDGDSVQELDGISEQTRIARTFVNAVILSMLGYGGTVFDHLIGANKPRLGKHLGR